KRRPFSFSARRMRSQDFVHITRNAFANSRPRRGIVQLLKRRRHMSEIQKRVWWVLRVGAAACFIGHGAFGIITKASWLPFFSLVGIGPDLAYTLMPIIGTVDIVAGISILARPTPVAMLYMTVWGLWTASLRPLAGDRFAEMIERAGNYGVPFALLLMTQWPRSLKGWLDRARPRPFDDRLAARVATTMVA